MTGDDLDPLGGKTEEVVLPEARAFEDEDTGWEDGAEPGDWEPEVTIALRPSDIGGVFGERFRVEEELGEGAMGRVVTAFDMQRGEPVALKTLHPPRTRGARRPRPLADVTPGAAGSEQRFLREVVALSAIEHPAVVKILAHGHAADGRAWIAMELLRGETLGARLERAGPLSLAEAWPILSTLCGGLAAAHRAGFVHRDLKPDNVYLPERGRPACKILDFGFARHRSKQQRITVTGAMIGTPRFMAPEILADAKVIDARTDVYSVGVLAFEMLTCRSIYPAEDFNHLVGCILTGRTIALRSVWPDAPPALEALLARATEREPARRIPSVEQFAAELAEIVGRVSDGPTARAAAPARAASWSQRPPAAFTRPTADAPDRAVSRPARRRPSRWAWLGVGALVALAVVLLAIAWRMAS